MDKQCISVFVPPEYKHNVKQTILEKNIHSFQEGYLKIFELGFEQFKKLKEKEA